MLRALQLGATLYIPATRPDLALLGNLEKYPRLRSLIYCLEDSLHTREVPSGLSNLAAALRQLEPAPILRFVRVRNPVMLRSVLQMTGVERLDGFVLPKLTRRNLGDYLACLRPSDAFVLMPTLESLEVFDVRELLQLRDLLCEETVRHRILALRIGGNDLLHHLGLRRPRRQTIYTTPLGAVITQLVTLFKPHGFNLTAPVCELLEQPRLLAREVRRDLACGLFGKTAVHPRQIDVIERQYRVSTAELHMAERILADDAPAVFRCQDVMCEPATHRTWAETIRTRAHLYGQKGPSSFSVDIPELRG